jgi:DNA-nicking Smr family endonuclease
VSIAAHPWLNPVVDEEPMQLPIDGVLDLHTFQPREVKSLVLDYLAECRARGILRVRIIHGKGIGQLRQTVHTILERHPDVGVFSLASEHFGGWGATIVHLQPPAPNP